MAEIEMRHDNIDENVWWLCWVERAEIVARVDQDADGRCTMTPQGQHWSPMKSFGRLFESPSAALREVELYFRRR